MGSHCTGQAAAWLLGGAALVLGLAACSPDYPSCDTDSDCQEGEFCVNDMCQQCRGDQDCPGGQTCAAGACNPIEGYCTTTSDCGDGQDCENNMCVTRATAVAPPPAPAPVDDECYLQSVYFNYDSSSLEPSARDQLSNNAQCMKEKSIGSVHLVGLTDPRGTEEYNMALGDRRAQSARKYLKSLGVAAEISYSSMGEEMATGADESGWSRDRRVDVKQR